jgi:hypothetical protein
MSARLLCRTALGTNIQRYKSKLQLLRRQKKTERNNESVKIHFNPLNSGGCYVHHKA